MSRIVANVNLDGIGGRDTSHRSANDMYVYITTDSSTSSFFQQMNHEVREELETKVRFNAAPPGFSSDHESFRDFHIPFIYFSTGLTEHYHKPSDEPHTIDYTHMVTLTRQVFGMVWKLGNNEQRLARRPTLTQDGFVCRPCNLACDKVRFRKSGLCPSCRMLLVPYFRSNPVNSN